MSAPKIKKRWINTLKSRGKKEKENQNKLKSEFRLCLICRNDKHVTEKRGSGFLVESLEVGKGIPPHDYLVTSEKVITEFGKLMENYVLKFRNSVKSSKKFTEIPLHEIAASSEPYKPGGDTSGIIFIWLKSESEKVPERRLFRVVLEDLENYENFYCSFVNVFSEEFVKCLRIKQNGSGKYVVEEDARSYTTCKSLIRNNPGHRPLGGAILIDVQGELRCVGMLDFTDDETETVSPVFFASIFPRKDSPSTFLSNDSKDLRPQDLPPQDVDGGNTRCILIRVEIEKNTWKVSHKPEKGKILCDVKLQQNKKKITEVIVTFNDSGQQAGQDVSDQQNSNSQQEAQSSEDPVDGEEKPPGKPAKGEEKPPQKPAGEGKPQGKPTDTGGGEKPPGKPAEAEGKPPGKSAGEEKPNCVTHVSSYREEARQQDTSRLLEDQYSSTQDPFFGGSGENLSFPPGSCLDSVFGNNGSKRHGAGNHTNDREKRKSDSGNKDNNDCVAFTSSNSEEARKEDTLKHSVDQYTSAEDSPSIFVSSDSKDARPQGNVRPSVDEGISSQDKSGVKEGEDQPQEEPKAEGKGKQPEQQAKRKRKQFEDTAGNNSRQRNQQKEENSNGLSNKMETGRKREQQPGKGGREEEEAVVREGKTISRQDLATFPSSYRKKQKLPADDQYTSAQGQPNNYVGVTILDTSKEGSDFARYCVGEYFAEAELRWAMKDNAPKYKQDDGDNYTIPRGHLLFIKGEETLTATITPIDGKKVHNLSQQSNIGRALVRAIFKDSEQQAGQDFSDQLNFNPQQDPFSGGSGENSLSFPPPGSSLDSVFGNNGSKRHGAGNLTNDREKRKSDSGNKDNNDEGKILCDFKLEQAEERAEVTANFRGSEIQAGQDFIAQQNSNQRQDLHLGGSGVSSSSFSQPGSSLDSGFSNNRSKKPDAGDGTSNKEKHTSDPVHKNNNDSFFGGSGENSSSTYAPGSSKDSGFSNDGRKKHGAGDCTTNEKKHKSDSANKDNNDCVTFTSSYREVARKEDTLKHSADQYTSAEVSLALSSEYTAEQMNYYKVCHVVADILPEALREIFKREWDGRYKVTLGEWKDTPKNGMDFWKGESPRNRSKYARLWKTMTNGDRAEWDCTMLFYAILFSDCINCLHPAVRSNVDDLRKVRNEEFSHVPRGHLSDGDFQNAILKISTAFQALRLPTQKIREIQTQTSFPTKELRNVLEKVDNLQQEVIEKGRKLEEKEVELIEKGIKLEEKENRRQTLEEQLRTEVSPFCILPPEPTHDVSPRRSEVDEITQHLKALKDANNDRLSTLYLSGNPGSGKSQLARLAAKRFFNEGRETPSAVPFVMTLNAVTSEKCLESYVFFARQFRCPEYSVTEIHNSKGMGTSEKIASLKTLVSAKIGLYTSWLLVVDNVTSLALVHMYLPEPGNQQWARGQLLITTQDTASIPVISSSIQHISVSKGMLPDDACSLLRLLSGVSDDEVEKEIAQSLDYQPLALASAAIYVRQVRDSKIASKFGWTDFLKKLEKGHRSTTENILAKTNPSYSKTMTTATTLALEKMRSDTVVDHFFTFLSLCAPQPILKDVVIDYIMEMEKEFEDKDEIGVRISRCPLLLFDEEESGVYIRVNGVVHDIVNSVTKKSAKDEQMKSILGALSSFSRFVDKDSLVIGTKIVPHVVNVITESEYLLSKEGISQVTLTGVVTLQDYSNVFTTLGRMCYDHSQYPTAKSFFSAALAIMKSRGISNELKETNIYGHLGLVHWQMGDLKQARDLHERALNVQLKKLGPEHVDVAMSYNNLGRVHEQLGDLKQAKECHERALEVQLKKLGPEHVYVAMSYNNLGRVHWQLGDLKQAKDFHERALDVQLKKLGPEHVIVALSYSNLGHVHEQLGDLKLARDFHERALDVQLKKLGPAHVDVAMSYNNLGRVHEQLGDLMQGRDVLKRALDIQLKKLGPEHVDVAMSYNNLGRVHEQLGDLKQARDLLERALDVQVIKLGPEHVDVAMSYNNLGRVHEQLGDLKEAKDCHERALDVQLKKLGPEHVYVARSYNNLGHVHWQLGDLKQAKDFHEKALNVQLKKLGPEHVDVAVSHNNLGRVHEQLGDLKEAKDCHKRALDVQLKKLGPEHVYVAVSYNNLGRVHWQLGDLKQAKDFHERALDVQLKKLGPEHVIVALSYSNLGYVCEQQGDLKRARDFHERALNVKLKKLGPEHVDVAMSYNNLGRVHEQLGDLKQARDLLERALHVQLKKLGPEHVYVATSYNNLGLVHWQLGDLKQAKDFHERALDVQVKKLGPEHVDVATSYNNLGRVHWQLGDLKQAKEFHEQALDVQLKKLGPEHVDVAMSYNNLGCVYEQLGDLKQAKDFHERALDAQLKKLQPEHVDVATSYNNLGHVNWQLGDLKQAKDCHERALDIRLNKLGPEHVDVACSYSSLGRVHEQLVDLKQAKECHERALDIRLKKLGPEHADVAISYSNLGLVYRQLGDLKLSKDCHER